YRVLHDPADRAALIAQLDGALSAVERLALARDQWALVRAGRATIDGFLDITDALGAETDYDGLDGLPGPRGLTEEQLGETGSPPQGRSRHGIARRFGPQLQRLGWEAKADEDDPTRLRRAALVRLVGGIAEAPGVLRAARERLERYPAD